MLFDESFDSQATCMALYNFRSTRDFAILYLKKSIPWFDAINRDFRDFAEILTMLRRILIW